MQCMQAMNRLFLLLALLALLAAVFTIYRNGKAPGGDAARFDRHAQDGKNAARPPSYLLG